MLRLSWEQFEQLEQLALRRRAAGIGAVLAEVWPALTERLQGRWSAFVEAAVLQGRKHGLVDTADLARYAGLWCIWGPAFDSKPAFAWAAEILADPRRSSTLKLHQLLHRTREELRRAELAVAKPGAAAPGASGAPALDSAQFDAALAKVDARVATLAASRTVFPEATTTIAVKACDIGAIDLMIAEPDDLQEYRHTANGWHRTAVPRIESPALHWTHAPEPAVELAVTSRPLRAGMPARMNLIVETVAACDVKVHPEIVHVAASGRLTWKGRDAARLSLALYALPRRPEDTLAGIGALTVADAQTVDVSSCGLRDAGAPFGAVKVGLRVYPASQWMLEIGHAAWSPMLWPAVPEAPVADARCRLECDGAVVDSASWQRAWSSLRGLFRQGLDRLFNEWTRVLDGQATRLEVEASPLVGQAGLTWGWRRTSASTAGMRVEGALDLLAMSIDLRLSGEIVEGPARSRIRLLCKGRSELRTPISEIAGEGVEGQTLKSAVRNWRFPFSLEIEPLAAAEPATLGVAGVAVPVQGALTGECGLRARADGAGHQWFFALRVEPISIVVELVDPLLGARRQTRKICGAMTLVDWSAG